MKRRFVLSLFAIMMAATITACGSSTTGTTKTTSATAVATSSSDSSEIYKVLTIKEDWEAAATITFADSDVSIDGSGAENKDGVIYITEGGAYTLTGTSSDAAIVIDTEENVKLILDNVDLTSTNGPVIYGKQVKNLYVELAAGTTNSLCDSNTYATDSATGEEIGKGVISCEDDLIILGDGTLNITANHKHGIVSDDKLYVEAGNINITSTGTDGIHANDLVCIDGGTLQITAASDIIESEDILVITGGTITGSSDDEGIESKNAVYINGGTIDISVKDDGINAATYLEINDGTVNVTCATGDALDCNGNNDGCIVINGGSVYVVGGNSPEGGIDADNASAIINGGEVIAIGDVNSPISEDSAQVTVVYGSFNKGETIEIKDSDGNVVFSTTPEVSGNTMIISSANITTGADYTIYANGTEALSFTADTTVVEAGGQANGMGGMGGHGGMGGQGGQRMGNGERPEGLDGEMPEEFNGQLPEGERPQMDDDAKGQFKQNSIELDDLDDLDEIEDL